MYVYEYVYHDPLTEALCGIAQQPCIWQYLTCFRKRSLVTEMRSRSDNSHVEYYTLQELASVLISRLVSVCVRVRAATLSISVLSTTVCNFRIIHPLSAIRQFRQFCNGTWERSSPVDWSSRVEERKRQREREGEGGRGDRLQTTLKFDWSIASGTAKNFSPAPPRCITRVWSQYVFITHEQTTNPLRDIDGTVSFIFAN